MKKIIVPENIQRKTVIETPAQETKGCTIQAKTIFLFILWCAICGIAVKECKMADIILQEEKVKLEQMKDGTIVDITPVISPDTLKIGKYQKEYMQILKSYQKQKVR